MRSFRLFLLGWSFSLLLTGCGGGGNNASPSGSDANTLAGSSPASVSAGTKEAVELKTIADVEKFLYTVKEKETTIKPFVIDGRKADKLALIFNDNVNTSKDIDLETTVSMFYYSLSDKKVVGAWDAKSLNQPLERVTKYYKDSILSKNIAQGQGNLERQGARNRRPKSLR